MAAIFHLKTSFVEDAEAKAAVFAHALLFSEGQRGQCWQPLDNQYQPTNSERLMTNKQSLIEFPCHFPIKVIGKKTENFLSEISDIARKHFPEILDEAISYQESQKANFLSITITVYVKDQPSLDALYRELTQHPDIKMVL